MPAHAELNPELRLLDITKLVLDFHAVADAIANDKTIKVVIRHRPLLSVDLTHPVLQYLETAPSEGGIRQKLLFVPERT